MVKDMDWEIILKRHQQVLYDKKWKRFLKKTWIFRHIPFIDSVFAAGSMALGNVRDYSDFDVIIASKHGRMFTSRFFLILVLDFLGWRRKNLDHNAAAADTICLNHFVTEKAYKLSPPHQNYWKVLYGKLVPVFGLPEVINAFWQANMSWAGERVYADDARHIFRKSSLIKKVLERFLNGKIGDWFEKWVRKPQLNRITGELVTKVGYKPRLIYSDEELELHLDTRRIENFK